MQKQLSLQREPFLDVTGTLTGCTRPKSVRVMRLVDGRTKSITCTEGQRIAIAVKRRKANRAAVRGSVSGWRGSTTASERGDPDDGYIEGSSLEGHG